MLIIVGEARARTITNKTSCKHRLETERIPKNSGQTKMQTKQRVIIAVNKKEVIPLNGLQSL